MRKLVQRPRLVCVICERRTFTLGFTFMTAIGLLYVLAPHLVLTPFLGAHREDTAVVTAAATLLWFAIVQQYCKGAQNLCVGLLRGIGNTKAGMQSTLIGYFALGVPAMAVFGIALGWHGPGVRLGLRLGFGATAFLVQRRFRRELRDSVPDGHLAART
ncbi:MATE family efflux transporter [Nocardia testacea]|uniref:MATE family efflux transporter n=1 Tax=Nocardia testacea TaxID=248551 RepID=UPI003A898324